MKREIPLKCIKEPKRVFDELGENCRIFEFEPEKGKKHVFKEVFLMAMEKIDHPEKSLEEKTAVLKIIYETLKEHYRDRITKTYFLIAKDIAGRPRAMIVQEELEGESFSKKRPEHEKARQQLQKMIDDIPRVVEKLAENPKLTDYSSSELEWFIGGFQCSSNVIVDKKGNIIAIDW